VPRGLLDEDPSTSAQRVAAAAARANAYRCSARLAPAKAYRLTAGAMDAHCCVDHTRQSSSFSRWVEVARARL